MHSTVVTDKNQDTKLAQKLCESMTDTELAQKLCESAYYAFKNDRTEIGFQLLTEIAGILGKMPQHSDRPVEPSLSLSLYDKKAALHKTEVAIKSSHSRSAVKRVFSLLAKSPDKDFHIDQIVKELPMCTRSSIQSASSKLQQASFISRVRIGVYWYIKE